MSIVEDMNNLRQEITDENYQRQEFISESKQNVSDLISDYSKQRQEMTTEQKADLRQSVSDLKNAEVIRKEDAAEYREELQETVSDLKDVSNALIADFVVQHQNRAAELNTYLEDAETERKANSAVLKANLRQSVSDLKNAEVIRKEDAAEYREELQKTVSDLKDASNALIADFAVQHQNRAAELDAYLEDAETERKANSAVLKAETTEFVTNLKNQIETLLNDDSTERIAMRRAWSGEKTVIDPVIHESVVKNVPVTTEIEPEPDVEAEPVSIEETTVQSLPEIQVESGGNGNSLNEPEVSVPDEMFELKSKMLEIVISSTDGISLTEIGDKLGVEWRKLIRPARDLLENEQVKKVDVNYFPKETQE